MRSRLILFHEIFSTCKGPAASAKGCANAVSKSLPEKPKCDKSVSKTVILQQETPAQHKIPVDLHLAISFTPRCRFRLRKCSLGQQICSKLPL